MSLNLSVILRESARRNPEHAAIIAGDTTIAYAHINDMAQRFGGALRSLGIKTGDHVAVMLPNVPEFTATYFGIHCAGAAVVPLNVLLKTDEIAYHLADSEARAFVVWEGFLEYAQPAFAIASGCKQLIVVTGKETVPPGTHLWSALVQHATPVSEMPPTNPDDTAVILYTSGTTGRPKGAELTHFNMFENARYSATSLLPMDGSTRALTVLPLFHSFGQTVMHNAVLFAGGTIVLLPRFDPLVALETMEKQRINFFSGVPTMYFALLNHPEAGNFKVKLEYCLSGGAPMPVEVMHAFDKKYGVNILEGYGLSETSPVASFNHLDRPKKAGSIGVPIWGVEMRLEDEHGKVITETDTPGEICIKGHNIMKGYFRRPEATEEAIKDGWFHSGDVATRDADGFYFIVDRKKDMIIRGGYNVYPREIEEILYGHPAIAEAAVIGIPHPQHGEEVKAVVALKPGQSVTEQALIDLCKDKLAAYKYPRIVEIIPELPKGPTGKILKRALRS